MITLYVWEGWQKDRYYANVDIVGWLCGKNMTNEEICLNKLKWRQIIWQCFNKSCSGDNIMGRGIYSGILLLFDVLLGLVKWTLESHLDRFNFHNLLIKNSFLKIIIKLTFSISATTSGIKNLSKCIIIKDRTLNFVLYNGTHWWTHTHDHTQNPIIFQFPSSFSFILDLFYISNTLL